MFYIWLATVSLLLRETYPLLFVTYFVTTILFVNKNDMKIKKITIIIIIIIIIISVTYHCFLVLLLLLIFEPTVKRCVLILDLKPFRS